MEREAIILQIARIIDVLFTPFVLLSAVILKIVRRVGLHRLKMSKSILLAIGIFPLRDHYYEPMVNPKHLRFSLRKDRSLPGIELNVEGQLKLLSAFSYVDELKRFPMNKAGAQGFYYENGTFNVGDAEYLYMMIRHFKPQRIVEIGSGSSTVMAMEAIKMNSHDNPGYTCQLTCIEPFENSWLEKLGHGVSVLRVKVEEVEKSLFTSLRPNDILFIDSSHVIRPQGDVLVEYLEILPILPLGVLVHVHDIFTPKDYLDEWIIDQGRFWNEQYLLEAFLLFNNKYQVIGALNYLKHNHFAEIARKCPMLAGHPSAEPGSFWMVRKDT